MSKASDLQPSLNLVRQKAENEKFCSECGQIILAKAEICPKCGCRQMQPSDARQGAVMPVANIRQSSELDGTFVGKMVLLLALNVLWNGLGNIAVGDRKGWAFGFLNWVFFILSMFTFFIPMLLFYALCGYLGYEFLRKQEDNDRGWYYANNGQKLGPFAAPELVRLIDASTLTPSTPVWHPGKRTWTPAGETPDFPVHFAGSRQDPA